MGLILPAGPWRLCGGAHALAHGRGLAGQEGFIDHEVVALHQQRIGGRPLALLQHEKIAPRHINARNALALAVADHEGARA